MSVAPAEERRGHGWVAAHGQRARMDDPDQPFVVSSSLSSRSLEFHGETSVVAETFPSSSPPQSPRSASPVWGEAFSLSDPLPLSPAATLAPVAFPLIIDDPPASEVDETPLAELMKMRKQNENDEIASQMAARDVYTGGANVVSNDDENDNDTDVDVRSGTGARDDAHSVDGSVRTCDTELDGAGVDVTAIEAALSSIKNEHERQFYESILRDHAAKLAKKKTKAKGREEKKKNKQKAKKTKGGGNARSDVSTPDSSLAAYNALDDEVSEPPHGSVTGKAGGGAGRVLHKEQGSRSSFTSAEGGSSSDEGQNDIWRDVDAALF
jgi:hypothetical protein